MDKTKRRRKRAADASGADSDKAQHVQALLRAGELTPEEVALAAHLRHKSAALVLGLDGRAPVHVHHWAAGLARFGKRIMVQAGHAMALKCLAQAQQNRIYWVHDLRRIVDCGTSWLRNHNVADNEFTAEATSRQIEAGTGDLTFLGGHTRTQLSIGVVLSLGHVLGAQVGDPPEIFTSLQMWDQPEVGLGWVHFARAVWTTAWIADNSNRGMMQYFEEEPCRAAVLHTIKFLRGRLLDQKWKQL